MIKSWKHKGLMVFFQTGSTAGIVASQYKRLRVRLEAIDNAKTIEMLNLPSFRLHKLSGNRQDTYSIHVNGNWRITFEFINGDAYILNYEDYH